jgi:hypothetical protein
MRVVLRTFLQIPNASIGKPTLISVAIISLAAIVVLLAVSFRNQVTEDELIGALPLLPPPGPTEVQPAGALAASPAAPPVGDAETIKGSSGASRELTPSPRPRPMHKPRRRQGHQIRNIPDNVLSILLAGSIEVPPMRPLAALMAVASVGDAETLVQHPVTSEEPGPLKPLAGPTEIQAVRPLVASTAAPVGDAETAVQSSRASRELVPSLRPRPAQKSRPRRMHNMRNRSNYSVATLPPASPTEVQPVRPLVASTAAPPVGDAETAMQSSRASRELVPSPPSRRAHKSRPRHARPLAASTAGPTEIQPMRPLSASTAAPAGDVETAMQSSGAPRELVPSPRPRPAQKSRLRRMHNMRNRSNYSVASLPPAGPTEVQPMSPLAASTDAPPAGHAETAMQSPGASRELVPSPRPRPMHKLRTRPEHNIRNVPNDVGLRDAVAILKDLREPSQIDRVVKDNPSNFFLLLIAEIRSASQETGRRIEKLIDEIEPPTLRKELSYATASRAQLEAYRLDLEAAEANAMTAMSRYVALLEGEREKVEVVVRLLDLDDRYIRAALSGIEKRQAQSTDLTSKMFSANAEFYRAAAGYVAFLIEQFENYKVTTNGHFIFSNQSIADHYDVAAKQINDAMKRIAELEEEGRKLAQFQQEEWERFASGN